MPNNDNSAARSDKPALDGPQSGSNKHRNCGARRPDDSWPPSAPCAKPKPLAIDLELYGRWNGEEHGEVF